MRHTLSTPSPHSLAAIDALARVAPAADLSMLTDTLDILAETHPLPTWHTVQAWTPTAAWRAVDVYDSERVLFIDYDGPHPHTLMAHIFQVGGLTIDKLALLNPGAATTWDQMHEPNEAPMPLQSAPVAEVLADLANALRTTDMTWPRTDDEDFCDHRALGMVPLPGIPARMARTRRTARAKAPPTGRGFPHRYRKQRRGEPVAGRAVPGLRRRLHRRRTAVLEPGRGDAAAYRLASRKAVLDADQRNALPFVLRRWLTFALTEQGIDRQWISLVVDAVDTFLPEFHDAFDEQTSWGPAKQVATALAERGVDLTDRHAVDDGIRQLNAEQLAHRLLP